MSTSISKTPIRELRHRRVRAKVKGVITKPRLAVFRSNRYINAFLVDDVTGQTLVGISGKKIFEDNQNKKNRVEKAFIVGQSLAEAAKEKKITAVVFDRSGYRYAGQVKAVADGARQAGLKF
ncbi:MAG: 50S ribosomal protein L18 [Patescibacteria group bacterium]